MVRLHPSENRSSQGGELGEHCRSITLGEPGILHGAMTYLLQDPDGQVASTHSISAGLDYPGVGPELAWLRESGRLDVRHALDSEALDALELLCRTEGILPALESAHALARTKDVARELGSGKVVLVNLSGRGDKDLAHVIALRARGGTR